MGTVTKGLIQRQDFANYDGTLATSRVDSSGGTTSGIKVGDSVDVLSVFGSGDAGNMTRATIASATSVLGSQNVALLFAPGTWTIDDDLTIGSNFTVVFPAGCVFSVSVAKTCTIAGVFFRQHATYSAGAGTFTISGTDLLSSADITNQYAADAGSADSYSIAPSDSIGSYIAGQSFWFKAANTNTGASTISVSGLAAKSIIKSSGSALSAGDIVASGIYQITYDGTSFQVIGGYIPRVRDDTSPVLGGVLGTGGYQVRLSKGIDVASANALTLGNDGNYYDITGTTSITSLTTKAIGTRVRLHFDSALTLTHNATDLILPGGASVFVQAGDEAEFIEYATADWVCTNYIPIAGAVSHGTKTTGTFTPEWANSQGRVQTVTNGGAHTLAPPSVVTSGFILKITNNASAGAVTTSGFGHVFGDALTTTNAHKFICLIINDGTDSVLKVKALQ